MRSSIVLLCSLALESLCGWDVPTEYLVAPVLIWTGLGCDNNTYPPNPTQIHSLQIKLSLNINKLKEVVNKNKNDRGRMISDSPMGHALYVYCASTVTSLNTGRFIIDKIIVVNSLENQVILLLCPSHYRALYYHFGFLRQKWPFCMIQTLFLGLLI